MSAPSPQLGGAFPAERVGSRYAVTLGSQVVRLLLSLCSAAIVPRALGPAIYGNYSFLLSTATTLRSFVDNAAQQAFFTFSSREQATGSLTKLYTLVLLAQFAIVLVLIGVAATTGTTGWLWPGQQPDQILLVTTLDWAIFLALSLQQLGDSKGFTVRPQLVGTAVALLALIGLIGLWSVDALNFYTFAGLNLAGAVLTCALLVYLLIIKRRDVFWTGDLQLQPHARRWWKFAKPLIPVQYYLLIVGFLGLYLIQRWYGSAEQGYYALALQWSALAMVFTNAALSIFWREIAHHTAAGDLRTASETYERFSRLLFFLVLVLSCWLSASSGPLVRIVAGGEFAAATAVLAVMAFYPVAQTLGQLGGASLKATERTAVYARWSVLISIPDVFLTYWLLAPATAPVPGLGLGAVGLALRTALYGLISVQVYDWLNRRYLGIGYAAALRARIAALLAIGMTAIALVHWGTEWLESIGLDAWIALAGSTCVYGAAILLIAWRWPALAGVTPEQVLRQLRALGTRRASGVE
jgi:O-antigen/teichoic acid export membrane protein